MTDEPTYERRYDIEGYEEKILLQIFEPKPREDGGWECRYRLSAPALAWESKLVCLTGDDGLDAFVSVLITATIELRSLSRRSGSVVSFMGDDNLDLIDRDFY